MFAAKVARSRTNAAPAPMAARSSVAPGREASHTASSEYEGRGANATERKGAAAPDFSAMAVFPPDRTSAVRSKSLLSIAGAADPLERLADQTAERVLRMPNPAAAVAGASCEDRARHDEKAEGLTLARTRSAEASALDGAAAPPAVREVLSSPGQRLEASARGFFEPRFGHDFGHVRIHADARAAEAARAANARAFTVGSRIVFGAGEWSPETSAGRALLAHELCHVAQQTAAPRLDPSTVADADQSPGLRLQRKPPAAPALLPTALDQYPAAERKSLTVFSSPVPPADIARIYAPVPAGGVKSSLNPDPNIVFAFDPVIAAADQPNLIQVAALITGQIKPPLGPGQTISVDVAPIGKVMRFSRIAHGTPVQDVMLIEQLGAIPAAAAVAAGTTAGQTKFAAKKYTFDTSLGNAGEQDAVRQAIAAVPDSALREGLTFARGSGAVGPTGEAGIYEPSSMTVRLYDKAFAASALRSGLATEITRTITHELGHAIDRKALDDAFAANTAAPSADNEKKVLAARALSGLRAQKSGANFTESEVLKDLKGGFREAAAKDGIRLDTSSPPRTTALGTTATLAGSPTSYADTGWVELFAESFSLFVTDPALLRNIRPNISAFLTKTFP